MKTEIQTLLTDVKAAARIGHAESLWVALDRLFDLPEVAGNPPMSEAFINQTILPIGETLANPRLTPSMLTPLVKQSHAAIRAIAAVSLAHKMFEDNKVTLKDLKSLGSDPRRDVRSVLSLVLSQKGKQQPERLIEIVNSWIKADSSRLREVAIQLIPAIAEQNPSKAMKILEGFSITGDPELRSTFVNALVQLAQIELESEILALMETWAKEPENYLWVIGKALSRSWAVNQPERSLDILSALGAALGPKKDITNALKALERHGAEIQDILQTWRKSNNTNLKALAEKVLMIDKLE